MSEMTPTPEERRINEVREMLISGELRTDAGYVEQTYGLLLSALDCREQEHKKSLDGMRCSTCGHIGGNGGILTGDENETWLEECPDCHVITAEEIRKAKEAGLREGFYQGQDAGIGEENPWDECKHLCAHCCERECNEKCFPPPSTDQENA